MDQSYNNLAIVEHATYLELKKIPPDSRAKKNKKITG